MRATALAALLLVAVQGCDSGRLDEAALVRADPAKRHPIGVEVQRAALEVPVIADPRGLDSSLYLETTRFVREYQRDGRGTLFMVVPRPGHDAHRTARTVEAVRHIIATAGVSPRHLSVRERHDGTRAIELSYERIAAIAPHCGDWSESVVRSPETGPFPNFGCASRRNLANMVAEPTDLIFPTAETDRGSDKRADAYKKFSGKESGGGGGGGGDAKAKPAAP